MKLALVIHDFDPGVGQGRYAVELCRRLAVRHEIDVISSTFIEGVAPGVRWVPVRAWRKRALTTVLSFLGAAEAAVRRRPYDLIHAQGLTCWSADVITAHICNAARLRHLSGVESPRGRRFVRVVAPIERAFYRQRRARHLIAISNAVARDIIDHYGWTRPFTVIPHGTDVDRFHPPASAEERRAARESLGATLEGRWIWLFVGEAIKGLEKVIAELPAFPDAELHVVTRSDVREYAARSEHLGLRGRVVFHPPIVDLAPVYRAADLFVYPSSYDTFGLVAAEAMATGLPVVLGRDIGAAELVVDGEGALLCDPERDGSLRAALHRMNSDRAAATNMGARARAAMERHSWDTCARSTEEVYTRVIGERT